MPAAYSPVTSEIVTALEGICGEEGVLFGNAKQTAKYSHDMVTDQRYARDPDVVVLPRSPAEAAAVLSLPSERRAPVTQL